MAIRRNNIRAVVDNGPVRNENIQSKLVKLVDENGASTVSTYEALAMAQSQGLDLVVVSEQDIPVVKIMDYGKFKFDQGKKLKEQKKKQQAVKTKEIKLRPGIQERDRDVKVNQGIRFLEQGHKLRVTITFSGRDHRENGWDLIRYIQSAITPDFGVVEANPVLDGKNLFMTVSPK